MKSKVLRTLAIFLAAIFLLAPSPSPVLACTLWSAAGTRVDGGGTILVKNRDWKPDHIQRLSLVSGSGYKYLALVAEGNDAPGAKAGVNEFGLAVVSASPPAYLERDKTLKRTPRLIRKILSQCRSVDEALKLGSDFWGPQFLMIADKREIAFLEIGINGEYQVERSKDGVLEHTNHYLIPQLILLNPEKLGTSSVKRLESIQSLLQQEAPFQLQDFIAFSHRQDQGPDNSIWRTGSKPDGARTMASWIVSQAGSRDSVLFLRMSNPGKPVKEYDFKLADIFSGTVDIREVE